MLRHRNVDPAVLLPPVLQEHTMSRSRHLVALSFCALLLTACGGGGGGGAGGGDTPLLPTLSSDTVPGGDRIDVSSRNLLPFHAGDGWIYDSKAASGAVLADTTRSVIGSLDASGHFTLRESDASGSSDSAYQLSGDGLISINPLSADAGMPGLLAALPSLVEYPLPFYAVGSTRSTVRQGNIGADLDGDGKNDYFRAEVTQVFHGFKTVTVLGKPTEVAWFTNTLVLTVAVTSTGRSAFATAVEEAWLAPNLGLVHAERSSSASDGSVPVAPYTIDLRSANIAGVIYPNDGIALTVSLTHSALVFDATRGVYYASVPGSVAGQGNRIATIDAGSGRVSYSGVVGVEPGPLALSADGSTLYVGLSGSGELLRLAPPLMTELGRVTLPSEPFFGQRYAEDIAISPASNGVVAVSLVRPGTSPRHGGVVLVRDGVLQPTLTQVHTGSNRIGFDATGAWLYGYNNETSENGLRRIEVLADGLAERLVVAAGGGFGNSFEVRDGLVVIGSAVYSADASLAARGNVGTASGCRKLPGLGRLVCLDSSDSQRLRVADSSGFSTLATPRYAGSGSSSGGRYLTPGPVGQVAINSADTVTLFTTPSLLP